MPLKSLRLWALSIEGALQHSLMRSFERRLGIETARAVDLRDVGVAATGRADYFGVPPLALRAALKRLRPTPTDVLADLGAGKGTAVIVAAQLPVGRVIGVEIADELTSIARANVERARPHLRCQAIELVTADASRWAVPEDVTVVYMYCPFTGEVFEAAAERIFASFDSRPRPLFIVYGYPWEHNRLIRTGRVRTVDVNPGRWPRRPGWWDSDHVFVTYQVTSMDGTAPRRAVLTGGYGWRRAIEYWSAPNATKYVNYPPGGGAPVYSE